MKKFTPILCILTLFLCIYFNYGRDYDSTWGELIKSNGGQPVWETLTTDQQKLVNFPYLNKDMVFFVMDGEAYHSVKWCYTLNRSDNIYRCTYDKALAAQLKPCSKCVSSLSPTYKISRIVLNYIALWLMYHIASFAFSYLMMQPILIITCALPLVRWMDDSYIDKKAARRFSYLSLSLNLILYVVVTYVVFKFGNNYAIAGYLLGSALSLHEGIRLSGRTIDNVSDFVTSYKRYFKTEDVQVSYLIDLAPTRYCSKCGSEVNCKTKKCTGCGKQYFSFKRFIKVFGILTFIIAFVGMTYLANLFAANYNEIYDSHEALLIEVEELKKENNELKSKIEIQNDEIENLKSKNEMLLKTRR